MVIFESLLATFKVSGSGCSNIASGVISSGKQLSNSKKWLKPKKHDTKLGFC